MTDPQRQVDRWLYGAAGLAALVAGGVALWGAAGDPAPAPPTTAPPTPQARGEARVAAPAPSEVRFADAGPPPGARVGPDFVPDLPEVPDLEAEPPPPVAPRDDPRMEQLGAEMRLLSRARGLLSEHPAEALGVLRTHRRRFPRGVLREERDAFSVEALLSLEHVDEAERRYYDFVSDYPDSAFRARLQRAMQRPPHEVGATGR